MFDHSINLIKDDQVIIKYLHHDLHPSILSSSVGCCLKCISIKIRRYVLWISFENNSIQIYSPYKKIVIDLRNDKELIRYID